MPQCEELTLGTLPPDLTAAVLKRLQVASGPPDLRQLQKLLSAYVRTVPWESAFRIVKRDLTLDVDDCSRWPVEFWHEHLQRGAGGTCFESNYAFFALLCSQGFTGYLTINNMGDSIGCHSAIIITIGDQKWLIDAGFPIYAPLPVLAEEVSTVETPFMDYSVIPSGANRYQIERRPHPQTDAFTLIDKPVSEELYRAATTADYLPEGHFLQRVIIHKIIAEVPWRFNSEERPFCLQYFQKGARSDIVLEEELAANLALKFDMDEAALHSALRLIGVDPSKI